MMVRLASSILLAIGSVFKLIDMSILASETSLSTKYGLTFSLILIIIIIPIIEELTFRGWIAKEEKMIIISLIVASFFLAQLSLNVIFPQLGNRKYLFVAFIVILNSILIFRHDLEIKSFIKKNSSQLINLSIFLFTIVHGFNYELTQINLKILLTFLFLLVSYPFSAYILTKIRIKKGLFWSMLLHISTNSLILIPVFFNNYRP